MINNKSPKCVCLVCGKEMKAAVTMEVNAWHIPHNGVSFSGGSNYGSSVYDCMVDGIIAHIVICDDCVKIAKERGRILESKGNYDEYR